MQELLPPCDRDLVGVAQSEADHLYILFLYCELKVQILMCIVGFLHSVYN